MTTIQQYLIDQLAADGVSERLAAFLVALELGDVDGGAAFDSVDVPTLAGWLAACKTRLFLLTLAKGAGL